MANQRQGILDIGPFRRWARRWGYLTVAFYVMFILSLLIHPTTNGYAKSAYDKVKYEVTGSGSSSGTNTRPDTSKPTRHPIKDGSDTIPNIAHFVYGLKDPKGSLPFNFYPYLSAYSALAHALYLHTNVGEEALRRAKSGEMGRWTKATFGIPGFNANYVDAPSHADKWCGDQIYGGSGGWHVDGFDHLTPKCGPRQAEYYRGLVKITDGP
ncbi:hypothetical protein PpBr36_02159 [Pyricularia pennisetigena]|uniref:hypothetical protein n=1 Tax=Pyricularia pennisetigena TaxID=1578925 RepID=UPI0011532E0A|nr:hypothetical protein PpBr36_02159 [Pyricularia pennisetigena]TLS29328.1 hypothetical protein PpBr36_02159 [Pyricularia pennisetigena]